MEQITLVAEKRDGRGKSYAKHLRDAGKVPGIVYGLHKEPVAFAVDRRDLFHVLDSAAGANVIISLQIEGVDVASDVAALVKQVQWSPVHKEPLNVDLQWISLTEAVTVHVPIVTEGHAPGVEEGGSVNQVRYEAEVACLPTSIPDYLSISIEGMEIGDTRYVSEIVVPEGVELLLDPEDAVVTIARPISEEELEVRTDELLPEGELEALELTEEEMEEEAPVEEGEEAEETESEQEQPEESEQSD